MHRYRAYGLTVGSEILLPEFVPADFDTAGVTIHRRRIDRTLSRSTPTVFDIGPRMAYLAWREVGAFLVQDGNTIVADLRPGVPDDLARLPLLGAVLAVLLHQRGFLVLHGSAGTIGGQAVIFVGDKGAGKSTMAATLLARGHPLIADDVVAVDCMSGAGSMIVSGYPQLKLSEVAAGVVLKERGSALPRIHRRSEKRWLRVAEGGFTTGPVRPGRIYALARGQACRNMPLAPQEALTILLQHSYMARFGRSCTAQQPASTFGSASRWRTGRRSTAWKFQVFCKTWIGCRVSSRRISAGVSTASAASQAIAPRPGREWGRPVGV